MTKGYKSGRGGGRSEVKELIFLHNMTLSQWQLNSHDLLLRSHKDKSSKDTEECFSKENRRLHSQQFLWKVPLPVSYKILYLKCQIKQSVLKGKLPKQSQTLISSRLMQYRQNYENRLATQSLNAEVPGQGKLKQLACCTNDVPVWYSSWIAPWLPIIWLCTFWFALKKNWCLGKIESHFSGISERPLFPEKPRAYFSSLCFHKYVIRFTHWPTFNE